MDTKTMEQPSGTMLHLGGHHLILDTIHQQQVAEAYKLVVLEAGEGEDVGVDEFPTEHHINMHMDHVAGFSLTEPHTGVLQAFITVAPSAYSRQMSALMADVIIVCAPDIKPTVDQALVQVALDLTIHLGYTSLLVQAFSTSRRVVVLRREGFTVIGCIPNSGRLHGKGWTNSFILYKDIKGTQLQVLHDVPPCADHKDLGEDDTEREEEGDKDDALSPLIHLVQKPRLQYLPCRYKMRTGEEVILRYMREEDIPVVYDLYKEASRQGNGYSTDEFETLTVFRFFAVDYGHAFIVEDTHTSSVLISISITPSTVCRTVNPQASDAFMIVDPKARHKGLGSEASRLLTRFAIDLGYTIGFGDCLVNNLAMLRILRNQGFSIVGYIPNAAKGKEDKMEDMVLFYRDLADRTETIARL